MILSLKEKLEFMRKREFEKKFPPFLDSESLYRNGAVIK